MSGAASEPGMRRYVVITKGTSMMATHGTPVESVAAPTSDLIQLGSAHEWSGV